MWLNKRLYEGLPFVYIGAGLGGLIASLLVVSWHWPLILTILGLASVTGGLVIWLKRRDYRSSRSRTAFEDRP